MSYGTWSWVMIALIAIGVAGLIATIAADISRSLPTRALNYIRALLSASGVVGAIGLGALAIGAFPFGHYEKPAVTGTGVNGAGGGIMTQGSKSSASGGQ